MDVHVCSCAYVSVCIRVYVYVYVHFCSEYCVHFGTGVLGTSACARVYATQVFFDINVHICEHTRCGVCTYVYVHVYMYMHAYVYGYVCASMTLLASLLRFYTCV